MDSISLDQSRVRNLNPVGAIEAPFHLGEKAAPLGLSGCSKGSIEKSSAIREYTPSRPLIPNPETPLEETDLSFSVGEPPVHTLEGSGEFSPKIPHYMWRLIEIVKQNDWLTGLSTEIFEAETQNDTARLKQLNEELKATMMEHFKAMYGEQVCAIWLKVFQDFFSLLAIGGGCALIASGTATAAGAMMVAAGGLALLNRIMTDAGGWKTMAGYYTKSHEMQEKYAQRLEAAFFLASLALTISSGAMALQAGALAGNTTVETAFKVSTMASSFLGAGTKLGMAAIKEKSAQARAKIALLTAEQTRLQYKLQDETTSIHQTQEVYKEICDAVKKMIDSSIG